MEMELKGYRHHLFHLLEFQTLVDNGVVADMVNGPMASIVVVYSLSQVAPCELTQEYHTRH